MNCGILGSNYIDLYRRKSVPKQFSAVFNICGPLDGGALEAHCIYFCSLFQKDFFQLKELESQCHKEKGITSMSVKEILTSLVDDGMVDTDKIGTSVYFWAFPSKASQNVSVLIK